MTSYNRVDGTWASQNAHLLTDILKDDWRFPGWILSDWGGVHSTVEAALAGLDQESGEENDHEVYFGAPLAAAVRDGRVPQARIDDSYAASSPRASPPASSTTRRVAAPSATARPMPRWRDARRTRPSCC